jgi:predicted SAM-dependent methyltransferase
MKKILAIYSLVRHVIVDYKLKILIRGSPIRIIVGASGVYQSQWIPTDIEHLDILKFESWRRYFSESSIDAILAEHVFEHLTIEQGFTAARYCHKFLKPNGYMRVAVPDGFHPSVDYINQVKPGGVGAGAEDHKILYNYKTLSNVFEKNDYQVNFLEYFNEEGVFFSKDWDPHMGMITRSKMYDERNRNGKLNYTSIIIDAIKRK